MKNSLSCPNAPDITSEFTAKVKRDNKIEQIKQYMPAVLFAVLILTACFIVPGFFSAGNLVTLLSQILIPLVCAIGMSYILIMGCMDLSLEGVIGFSGVILSYLVANNKTNIDLGFWGVMITIAAAMLIGMITGLIHTKLHLPSFIVTYAMGIILKGFAIMIYRGAPAAITSELILKLPVNFLGLPVITWLSVIVFLLSSVILKYTSFGRAVFAIGDNENVIRSAGVNVDRVKIMGFVICAFCGAAAGIIGLSRLKYGDISIGQNRVFTAITACVVGGISLDGGKGGMLQCLMGVLFITVLNNILVLAGIDMEYQDAVQGVIVIISVIISTVRRRNMVVK